MLDNNRLLDLKSSLRASEDLRRISGINIANANTLGYKALEGTIAPDCECSCFEDLLPEISRKMGNSYTGQMRLEIGKSDKEGKKTKINGKNYEGSNVDTAKELNNLVTAASLTRSVLATIQIENKLQMEALNTLRGA